MPPAGQRPRLQPGITLPRAPLRHQVLLECGERGGQRSAVAIGAQPHVDAKHVAVCRRRARSPRSRRRPSRSKNSRLEMDCGAVGLAFLGIDEDEVDVRRDVELAAAELAHRDDDQLLRRFRFPRRSASRGRRPARCACTVIAARSARSASVLIVWTTSTSVARPVRSRASVCRNTRRRSDRNVSASAGALPSATRCVERRRAVRPVERCVERRFELDTKRGRYDERTIGIAAERECAVEVHHRAERRCR